MNFTNIQAIGGIVVKELCRRKDFYVLFILTAVITLAFASMNFFDDDGIVRSLKEICLALIWIATLVIAIVTAARQIPAEREARTIFPLLAKPVSRMDVVLGKFLGCWIACGLALLVFYIFFAIVAASREHTLPVLNYFQAITLHWFMLGVVVALTLLGSLVFTAVSSNATICMVAVAFILLLGRHLNKVALAQPEPVQTLLSVLYFGIPHLEFFDVRDLIVHNWDRILWGPWCLALVYASVYAAIFLFASSLLFRRTALT